MRVALSLILLVILSVSSFAQDRNSSDSLEKTLEYLQKAKVKSAKKEIEVTVRSVDITRFPVIKIIIEAYNKLGEPVQMLSADSLFVYEDGEKKEVLEVKKLPAPDNVEVDFVFLIDITGSMQQKIDQVRRNISKFSSSLMKRGIDYRIGLILFADEIDRVYQPTKDVLDFLDWLSAVKARGGGDEKENALEAIEKGIEKIKYRQNANKVLVLVTDAPFHEADDIEGYGITNHTKESIIKNLQINQTRLFSIVPPKLTDYKDMSSLSRGNTFDIDYPFSTVLDNFSNQLTNLYMLKYSSEKESIPDSIQISFFSGDRKKLIKKTIPIVELGRKLIIENLLFKTNKSELPPNVKELDLLAEFMQQKPNIAIMIEGHTDNVGREEYNDYLSLKRAESVKQYLVNKGVDTIRIKTKGYGEQRPIATNATDFGRRLNRRTEIIIVAK